MNYDLDAMNFRADRAYAALHGEPLEGAFDFEATPQGADFWREPLDDQRRDILHFMITAAGKLARLNAAHRGQAA